MEESALHKSRNLSYRGSRKIWTSVSGLRIMDQQFRRDRARLVRELADKADPWIRNRLLKLAGRYEGEERGPSPLNTPADLQGIGWLGTGAER